MSKIKVRTQYKIVGSDYSAQEPRLTAFMSGDTNMLQAYKEGKDLYCVIAQSVFNNEYSDNTEFYKEGTVIDIDGKKSVAGTGQEYTKTTENKQLTIPYFYLVQTMNGLVQADSLKIGTKLTKTASCENIQQLDDNITVTLSTDSQVTVKSPPRITNKAGKERRSAAKTLLLAICYGMSGATAGARMGKTAKEGKELLATFFNKFPKVKELIESSKEFLRTHGYVEDWAGRRRHLDDYFLEPYSAEYKDADKLEGLTFNPILDCENRPQTDATLESWVTKAKSTRNNNEFENLAKEAIKTGVVLTANTGRIAQAERQCLNARIQGGAASLTKLAMVNIFNDAELKKYQANLIITVHDEVLVECPEFYADAVEKRLPEVMVETAAPYISVPMKCDPYNVYHWYEDTFSNALQTEFSKAAKKMSHEQALEALCEAHPECTRKQLTDLIDGGADAIIKF